MTDAREIREWLAEVGRTASAVVLFLVAVIVFATTLTAGAVVQTVSVIDCDTVTMGGTTYRLVGFDAPRPATGQSARSSESLVGWRGRAYRR